MRSFGGKERGVSWSDGWLFVDCGYVLTFARFAMLGLIGTGEVGEQDCNIL